MPSMAPPLRRLPKALLVAALVAFVFGGLLGGVQAAGGESGAGADEGRLRLARPSVGDQWSYQAIVDGPWRFGEEDEQRAGQPFPYAEFRWADPVLVRDADGREVAADVLKAKRVEYEGPDVGEDEEDDEPDLWVPREDSYLHILGGTEVFAHEFHVTSNDAGGGSGGTAIGVGGVFVVQTSSTDIVAGTSRYFGDGHAPCLSRTTLQEGAIELSKPLVVDDDCLPSVLDLGHNGRLAFSFRGRERVAGHDTLRFDAGDESSLWFSPGLPVPVQWWAAQDGLSMTLTLATFQAGHTPLGGLGPMTGPSMAPPVELAPRQLWGPDDTGVQHPWPASAAFKAAREDPAFSDLRDWLAAHPKGTTILLEYGEDLDSSPQQRWWFFGLSDGSSSTAFVASRDSFDGTPLPPAFRFQGMAGFGFILDLLAPSPEMLPAEVPTAASAMARWAAYESLEGRSGTGNGYGMALWCVLDCAYSSVPLGGVVAGHDPVAFWRADYGELVQPDVDASAIVGRTFTGSQLELRPDGTTQALVNWTGYDTGLGTAGPLSAAAPVDPTAEPSPPEAPRLVFAALLPNAEQSAAITVASALAGLLYWLWPTLKGGAAGLFSRISGPALLEHPSRAQLLQIVQAEPGIHFQDLVRRSGLANGTAVHHLGKLSKGGLVSARALGRYTCYFPGSSPGRAALAAAPVLRSEGARRVYEAIQGRPGLSGLELAGLVDLQPSTVNYHVQRLVDGGLVRAARDGRSVRLSPAAAS